MLQRLEPKRLPGPVFEPPAERIFVESDYLFFALIIVLRGRFAVSGFGISYLTFFFFEVLRIEA